jgi:hypothetical protein
MTELTTNLGAIRARFLDWYARNTYNPEPLTDADLDLYPDADTGDETPDHYIVRNDIPALLDALEADRATIQRVRALADEWACKICGPDCDGECECVRCLFATSLRAALDGGDQ